MVELEVRRDIEIEFACIRTFQSKPDVPIQRLILLPSPPFGRHTQRSRHRHRPPRGLLVRSIIPQYVRLADGQLDTRRYGYWGAAELGRPRRRRGKLAPRSGRGRGRGRGAVEGRDEEGGQGYYGRGRYRPRSAWGEHDVCGCSMATGCSAQPQWRFVAMRSIAEPELQKQPTPGLEN